MAEPLLTQLGQVKAPGTVLYAEDFAGWNADPGWTVVDIPEGGGKCAQITSATDFEDLVLKKRIPVTPGRPIALFYRTRFVAGNTPLLVRIDFFDADGKTSVAYAEQRPSRQGSEWTDNTLMISDWFPAYTRALTVYFRHGPDVDTTSLLADVQVVNLAPAIAGAIRAEVEEYTLAVRQLARDVTSLPGTSAGRSRPTG